jgi:adenylate cyclase
MSVGQRSQSSHIGAKAMRANGGGAQRSDQRSEDANRQSHAADDHILGRDDPRVLSPDAVRRQLQRILDSPAFEASERRRRFLNYVVDEFLAGRADRLKGYAIATDVFGRDESFDPQTDPVVRLEARRLRRALEHYYLTAGRNDPIRIEIPKGGYVPICERREQPSLGSPAPAGELAARVVQPPPPRDARPRWYRLTTAFLAIPVLGALGWLGTDLLASRLSSGGSQDAAAALPRGPKIAVLPFLNLSGDPGQAYLAEGVTDQIVTDLARFKALFVLSTESTAKYQEQSADPQRLNRELGVDYLLDGSVRRESDTIRLSTRLVDAESGKIIWSETYGDELIPSNVFKIQEDVSEEVSAIIASNYGLIAEAGLAEAQRRPPKSFVSYDCVLRYYHYETLFEQSEHAKVRACLERVVELDPDYADAWAVLANIYAQEHRFGFNPRPELYDSYERSLTAAYRAVDIEPRNPTAQLMLANALFDRHNLAGFRAAGERAISLNPNDPDVLAHYGMRLTYIGEWDRGVALVTKAIALNPEHPQWYLDPIIYYHYQTRDYERALMDSQRQEFSDDFWVLLFRAMILGQLGRSEEAQPMIEAALRLRPDVRERLWDMARIWNVPDPQIEHIADGLRKAGLVIEPAPRPS